jgi:hypothetical protein
VFDMARLLLLRPTGANPDVIVARPARLRERLAARIRATRLDAELARGVAPEARAPLALRARALGEYRIRSALGRQIRRIVDDARGPHDLGRAQVPTRRDEVLAAALELDELAERLLTPGPVAAGGLAQVRLLLTDGASPLYFRGAPEGLRGAVDRALTALRPSFSW